jgi:hypothetical protein
MDDKNMGGGFLIASEADLDDIFGNFPPEAFDIQMIPGDNIMTGCYGLFLVALDQCTSPTDKTTLKDATTALSKIEDCLVSGVLTLYYNRVKTDYAGILTLANVMIFLAEELPGRHVGELSENTMVNIDHHISSILGISQEEAAASIFEALGFNPLEVQDNDGTKQLELDFC